MAETEVKEVKATKQVYEGPKCSVCGRPLTDEESVKLGIGPVCRAKGWTAENVAARMAELKSDVVPEGWIAIAEMHKEMVQLGIPVTRMVRAIGGDRGMEDPLNKDFQVVYVNRKRYISPDALSPANIELLRSRTLGKAVPEKEPKERKPRAKKAKDGAAPVPKPTSMTAQELADEEAALASVLGSEE